MLPHSNGPMWTTPLSMMQSCCGDAGLPAAAFGAAPAIDYSQFIKRIDAEASKARTVALTAPPEWASKLNEAAQLMITARNNDELALGPYGANDCARWQKEIGEGAGWPATARYEMACKNWVYTLETAWANLQLVEVAYSNVLKAAGRTEEARYIAGLGQTAGAGKDWTGSIPDDLEKNKPPWWETAWNALPTWGQWAVGGLSGLIVVGIVGKAVLPWWQMHTASAAAAHGYRAQDSWSPDGDADLLETI